MVVNHNMASICESRQLRYNVKKMEVSSKKLATGYKIIGANDDAAGLQISETMRHQTRGLNKASRNSQDGISMLQTADAALQETQDVLGRMVELTTQAANDTHTDADRRSIQDELDQLNQEVDRIAYTTNFNQQYILAEGTPQAAPGYYRIQSGALNGQSIDIQFVNASKESLGVDKVDVSSHQKLLRLSRWCRMQSRRHLTGEISLVRNRNAWSMRCVTQIIPPKIHRAQSRVRETLT